MNNLKFRTHRLNTAIKHTLMTACLLGAGMTVNVSSLANVATQQNYQIQASTLAQAINQFAEQSGILLQYDAKLVESKHSQGLNGSYSVDAGFAILLAPHGLQLQKTATGYSIITSPTQSRQARDMGQLKPIDVTASGTASRDADAVKLPVIVVNAENEDTYTYHGVSSSATKLALTAKETPQSISVITRQRMDDQKLDSVIDVLDATVGISSFRQSVGADLAQPYSRGFSVSNYLVDGVPRSTSSVSDQLNTAAFERVDVLRGASGLTNGMGYPGASVNMVRKRPTDNLQMSLNTEVGSWDRYGMGFDVSGAISDNGHIRSRLVTDYKEQKSWIDHYNVKQSLIYGITEVDITDNMLLTAGLSYSKNDNDSSLRSGVPLYYSDGTKINLPRSFNVAPNWSYYDLEEVNAFAALNHIFSNGWKANIEVNYQKQKSDFVAYWVGGSVDSTTGLGATIAPVRWYDNANQYNIDTYLSGNFSLLGRNHEFVTGLMHSQRKADSIGYGGWLFSWNSDYIGTINTPIWLWDGNQAAEPQFTKSNDVEGNTKETALYFTSRFNLNDHTNLIVGSRVMDWENDSNRKTIAGVQSKTEKKETGVVIPYAGVTFDINKIWTMYGSYTQIFRPQSASVVDVNRKQLDPEEGSVYEIGIKGSFSEKLDVNFAIFKANQDKLALYDETISAYKLLEGINTEGAELEITGEPIDGWNISLGYAYSLSEDKDGKRAMERIPKHTIKSFTTYQFLGALNNLTIGGGITWKSKYGWEDSKSYGWEPQDSYFLTSLMARYNLSKSTEISAHINNLFDKKYYTALADIGLYGAPRNFMISAKYKF